MRRSLVLLVLLVLLLSACGQAGDLYLPGQEPAQQPKPVPGTASSTPLPTESEKKKD